MTLLSPAELVAADGAVLRTYTAGRPDRPAVVVASACGMPAPLCHRWMDVLAADHHVITWETRGLFGEPGGPEAFDDLGHRVADQAADLIAVMDHHGVPVAHLMGLCGGAVIALLAAADRPDRVASLSLWHGDYSGSPGWPTTDHQDNLKALLAIGAGDRADAAAINAALASTTTADLPPDVVELVAHPYGDDELFYRYCVLTGAIMHTDVRGLLASVPHPSLVVTSEDDHTAHPAGSHRVAEALPGGVLRVEPHGDHISVFGAGERLQLLLTEFLETQRHV